MDKIKNNSPVLFYFNHSKKWLMKISKKESFHTHIGIIKHSDAIGKEYGSRLIQTRTSMSIFSNLQCMIMS